MNDVLLSFTALAAYVASVAIRLDLPDGRRIGSAAVFAPAVTALPLVGLSAWPWTPVVAFALGGLVALAGRRKTSVLLGHAVGFMVAHGLTRLAVETTATDSWQRATAVPIAAALGAVAYAIGDGGGGSRSSLRALARDRNDLVPVTIVLASTASVLVLVIPQLGAVTFLLMFAPLLAARYEFRRFVRARETFYETARALASLVEGAGYVPTGHSQAVSDLSVAVSREVGMSEAQVQELELLGLLHDVGKVTHDSSDRPESSSESSREFLERTMILDPHAATLRDAFERERPKSLAGKVLREVHEYVENGSSLGHESSEVVAMLADVVKRS